MNHDIDLLECLDYIDPAELDYDGWLHVGMGLKEAGYTASDWEEWSARDIRRFHPGECENKWASFQGNPTPITGGTIVQMAQERGWHGGNQNDVEGYELDWDFTIGGREDGVVIDKSWLERREVTEPATWRPEQHLIRYLETLFEASENVGYVTESWEKDGKFLPTKGSWGRSAGQLIQELNACDGDIGSVMGDCKPEAGAWIRFNPLDGKGCKNENVTEYRYALVESDTMEIDQQNAIIRELELPVACLVYSGGKSLHAIVRIEAADYQEYRKRVDYLYTILKKNGMQVDTQNKNPSRLSRMPGVTRNGHKQFLVDTNIGKASWNEWKEWIESVNDDLPDPESLTETWDSLPDLAEPLIAGVLRQGHKMLLAGPSKAGKSFALIELTIAIAEGKPWLGFPCAKGRVMYVNLELDRASCLHRFRDVYEALGWEPTHLANVDIWNLRGRAVPMDKLAPKLIRRCMKKNYIAIIIDPIYKIITGDENSADQMAAFCNQFDRVCTELGAAVIYCHHHSKGSQGQKRSMDRASGSGVFARDPDALLDLIELEVPESAYKAEEDKAEIEVCKEAMAANILHWQDYVSQDDQCSAFQMREAAKKYLSAELYTQVQAAAGEARKAARRRSAWRIEGTLREFPKFDTINLWFDYPQHRLDDSGILQDLDAEGEAPPYAKASARRKESAAKKRKDKEQEFETAIAICNAGEPPTFRDLVNYFSGEDSKISDRTIRDWIKQYGYTVDKKTKYVIKKADVEEDEQTAATIKT